MENVTRTVALVWRPVRYEVQWAYEPGEVPEFDPSRGGDPYAPHVEVQHSDIRIIFSAGASLGGGNPPPEETELLAFPLASEQDRVQEAFPNYPRLVRVRTDDVGERPGDNHPLQVLAALTRFSDEGPFMVAARDAAEQYGPLAHGTFSFSLVAWRHAATELHSHMLLLKRIREIRESRPARTADVELDGEVRKELLRAIEPLRVEFARPYPFQLHQLLNANATLLQVQAALADLYWSEFSRNLLPDAHQGSRFDPEFRPPPPPKKAKQRRHEPTHEVDQQRFYWTQKVLLEVGRPGQILVRCGSRGWAFYELWQLATRRGEIRECQGCKMLFSPNRSDHWHCTRGCRVKSYRRRKDAKERDRR